MNDSFDNYYPKYEGSYVSSRICVCDEKSAVKRDLSEIIKYLKANPGYHKMARGAGSIFKRIENNTFTIESMTEAYCGPR